MNLLREQWPVVPLTALCRSIKFGLSVMQPPGRDSVGRLPAQSTCQVQAPCLLDTPTRPIPFGTPEPSSVISWDVPYNGPPGPQISAPAGVISHCSIRRIPVRSLQASPAAVLLKTPQ